MKSFIVSLFLAIASISMQGQNISNIDSLKNALLHTEEDTTRVNLYQEIGWSYVYTYPDTALSYAYEGLELAQKINFKKGQIVNLHTAGEALAIKGNYTKALELKLEALKEAEGLNDPFLVAMSHNMLGANYYYSEDYRIAILYFNKIRANQEFYSYGKKIILGQIGQCYLGLNILDSAHYYLKQAYELDVKDQDHWAVLYHKLAAVYEKKGNYAQAIDFYRAGNQVMRSGLIDIIISYAGMASVFNKMGRQDSAIYYGSRAVEEHLKRPYYPGVINAGNALVDIFKSKGALDSAFKYQEIVLAAKDSLFSREKVNNLQNLSFNEQHRQQEALAQQARYRNKLRMNTVLGITFTLLVVALLLWRNIRHQQKSYSLLQKQKQETEQLRVKAEDALTELKATQAQLLQREKMASLGELTAGIAHEIQNPLNFVNNFSEINKELIGELKQEAHSGNITEVIAIADNLEENEQKIARHGKRADNIVKGMLEHSRTSKGEKQFTDINALADEYLRLSYHGIRAKDKSFNATIETHYDESIGKISVVPQDIGRVLLNLFNNAFYAVTQKKKATDQKGENYEPTVLINTKRENDKVIIAVRDNGIGIPQKVVDKIFQPFFTTKPTGQGTGLGLSLSYDIVKAHGGELKVETKEGEYAEFIVSL